ncbi:MAG: hypothetical protein PHE29_08120 [Tissierellia bacterium]|nr:hypothetical protein [Tissierellia bacterium]
MELLLGIITFIIFIVAALKVGVVFLKILFTILGGIVGLIVFIMLLPLGIGILSIMLVPAIVIGIIIAIIKCLTFIF